MGRGGDGAEGGTAGASKGQLGQSVRRHDAWGRGVATKRECHPEALPPFL